MLIPDSPESGKALFESEHVKSIFPLDDALGISRLPFKMTPALMLRCAYWAQNQCSYQAAEDVIRDTYGMSISDDTIRQVANFIGRMVFEEDCRRADCLSRQLEQGNLNFSNKRKGVLYIEADGAALNTRHQNDDGSTWRESKLGVVYSSDNIYWWTDKKGKRQHKIQRREYVPYIGCAGEFSRHLYRCAVENGYGDYKETVILSDGAPWIANMAEELFPDAQHILDLFHLKENVYDFSKSKFGMNESKYVPWAERIIGMLEDGHTEEVLAELNPDEKYTNCVNLYHYITMHMNHIQYPEYKAKGYFCGSGAVESGNKVVLQKRLKQAGMRWDPQTAQYLLTLKAKYESGRWERDVVEFIMEHLENLKRE